MFFHAGKRTRMPQLGIKDVEIYWFSVVSCKILPCPQRKELNVFERYIPPQIKIVCAKSAEGSDVPYMYTFQSPLAPMAECRVRVVTGR